MNCNIAVIKGDGIGPEVVTQAMKVLDAVGEKFGHTFNYGSFRAAVQSLFPRRGISSTGFVWTFRANWGIIYI